MRISDWSSDVCSSDLPGVAICPIRQGRAGKASASLPEPFQASRQIGDEVGGVFYADVQTDEWPLGFPGLCGTVILRIDRQSEAFISAPAIANAEMLQTVDHRGPSRIAAAIQHGGEEAARPRK